MTTYTAQLEQIKSNALRDIRAYMKSNAFLVYNVETYRLLDGDLIKGVFHEKWCTTEEVVIIADYINSINDK